MRHAAKRRRRPRNEPVFRIQFELIAFSERESWLPSSSFQQEALAAIKELARDELGVLSSRRRETRSRSLNLRFVCAVEAVKCRPRMVPVWSGDA
jgi:hypothetical protein